MQEIALATDVDVTRDGVDVPDERDRLGSVTPGGDDVAGGVDVDVEPGAQQPRHQQRRHMRPPGRSRWAPTASR